jgi:NADPH-dependent 2,4-dienoyl-CoA reductase/sulfur reductase-like enzyme
MEAARVSAIRGHDVTLFEKERRLGGLLPWVALIKGLDVDSDAMVLANYLQSRIAELSVRVRLGEEFRPSVIEEIHPDAVILATGTFPTVPDIPGINNGPVMHIADLHRRMKDDLEIMEPGIMRWMSRYWDCVGKNVVIVGGGIEGSALAEFLVERCRNVTLVDEAAIWGDEPLVRSHSMEKVTRLPGVRYEEITAGGLVVLTAEGRRLTLEADTIITAPGPRRDVELYRSLQGMVPEVYLLGMDEREPASIMNAIGNGYRVAKGL